MQIAQHLPEITRLIGANPVVSIVANTGSGKSVGIPAAIAATGAKCFVVVPTRTAAISLAEYQRALQKNADPKINANRLVGYAAEGNINYGSETMIAYVTGGHMRKKMLFHFSNGTVSPIDFCDVLVVDEAHSGSIDTTLIISLWMTAASSGVTVPRLVIASATPVPMYIKPDPVLYKVESVAFPIEYRYIQKDIDIDDPNGLLYTETAILAANVHKNTDINTGHILVFAAGSAEVETITSKLKELLEKTTKKADIISAFGALKQEDIALIYKQTGSDERKIIIATNIAEMSITIGDVGHVIDTMVEKRAETSQSGGFRLTTHYISKDSAKQRAGRTGRTRPGICYRMCTEERYERLENHRPPEIDRIPIYDTVMELLDVGLPPEMVLKGVDSQRITNAIYLLVKLGMIEKIGNTVTDMGHFAPNFPLSVRNAAFLWQWIKEGYPIFPGIIVATLIDCYGPSYFHIPRRKPDQSIEEYNVFIRDYKSKHFAKYAGYNDLETALNMWNELTSTIGGINTSPKILAKWSRSNSINNKKIRELLLIVNQSVKAATRLEYDFQIGPFTTQGVMKAARPILLSVYSDMTFIQRRDFIYFSPITREDYRLDNRDAINKFSDKFPPGIIALVTAEIKTQKGVFRVIGFGIDTDTDGLGRPIVPKTRSSTPRSSGGHRSISKSVTIPQSNDIIQSLNKLADIYIGSTTEDDISSALSLLTDIKLDTPLNVLDFGVPEEETDNFNPKINVSQLQFDDKQFNLVQDSYLPVGTKQRGLNYFIELKNAGYSAVATYDKSESYDQVVLAWCCKSADLSCHIFIPKNDTISESTQSAADLGAFVYQDENFEDLARNFSQENSSIMFIEANLNDPTYIQYLAASIQQVSTEINPTFIWTSDSVVSRALALVFPDAYMRIVQVSDPISRQLLDDSNVQYDIYVAPEDIKQPAEIQPPYESLPNSNAKVWRFVENYGINNDYIWNIK